MREKTCEEIRKEFMEKLFHENLESNKLTSIPPARICIFQVGNNPASSAYVRGKMQDCEYCGIYACLRVYPSSITEEELISEVRSVCDSKEYTGVIVQVPLPAHISVDNVMSVIPPEKDIDGFNPESMYTSCTPKGIMMFLDINRYRLEGKHCVIINRSPIVGRPLINLFLEKNATVTVCHSKTKNLRDITKSADVIVTAVGIPNFITQDMINNHALIFDVGITKDSEGNMCGDVAKYVECYYKTPVPKGVGLLTRTAFVANCLESRFNQKKG